MVVACFCDWKLRLKNGEQTQKQKQKPSNDYILKLATRASMKKATLLFTKIRQLIQDEMIHAS